MHVILFVPDLVVTENIMIFGTHLYLLLASSVANCHGYWDMVLTVIVRCRTLEGWLFKCLFSRKGLGARTYCCWDFLLSSLY